MFVYEPDIDVPGGTIRQTGDFVLTARGGPAFGGSLAFFFTENVGIEARVDTVDFDIDLVGPRFESDVDLGPGLPPASVVLNVPPGVINVERLYPLSLNLKARSSGRARFQASGGVSYLPRVRFEAAQPVTLGLSSLGSEVELASVVLNVGALAEDSESRWGFNGGAGFEVDVAPVVSFLADVRVHAFQPQTFVWQRASQPGSELDELLLEALEDLPPVEIDLFYFQVTAGLLFRF